MPGTYITDMRHFVPEDPATPLPAPMARLRAFFGDIVRAATAGSQAEFVSGIPCRRRPGNRRCLGTISVSKTVFPEPFVFWECTVCEDNGRIAGFQRGPDDLSAFADRGSAGDERRHQVLLTAEEYRSWISGDTIAYDAESMQTMYSAVVGKRGIVISATADELDFLLDATAADANHETRKKRRDYVSSIFVKLGEALRKPPDRAEPRPREKHRDDDSVDPLITADSPYAHGFFSAIVAGPMVMPTKWLQHFLPPQHESIEDLNACAQRAMHAYNEISDQLSRQRERFGDATLAIAVGDARGNGILDWKRGFVDAMGLNPDEWTTFLSTLTLEDLLAPLAIIAQISEDTSKRDWLTDQGLRENIGRSLGIMTVRLWEAYRGRPSVLLELGVAAEPRQQPAVSRNAPCPCGSGKKLKRCCGAALRGV